MKKLTQFVAGRPKLPLTKWYGERLAVKVIKENVAKGFYDEELYEYTEEEWDTTYPWIQHDG